MSGFRVEQYPDHEALIKARSGPPVTLGGSDAPTILQIPTVPGGRPLKSRFTLWAEKTGKIEPQPDNVRLRIGRALEPTVRDLLAQSRPELVVLNPGPVILRSQQRPWQHYSPDGVALPRPAIGEARPLLPLDEIVAKLAGLGMAECKTVEPFASDDWDAEPSEYAICQVQHGLAVTGWEWGIVGALIGFSKFKHYRIERHEDLINEILEAEAEFLACCVQDIPPQPDASESTKRALRQLWPKDSGEEITLDPEQFEPILNLWRQAKEAVKAAEERVDFWGNQLRLAIGDATRAVIPGAGALTHKTQKEQHYEVHKPATRVLREVKL